MATREAILRHALDLFLERGYGATTVSDIARAAQVATPTVYASAGGKAALFALLLKPAINDPAAAEAAAEARRAEDPRHVLALCAKGARLGQERYWDLVYGLMRRPPEDDLALEAVTEVVAKCREALTAIAEHLMDLGALKTGVGLTEAADTLWFYFGQNAWCSLVGDSGWTFDRAEEWLLRAAIRDLLPET
ncbi:TetR/AcrR family transcriptional regulator [Actinoallomurus rhizosphaericola]|uniref:TetR/AcrR family transcriptional regulator n=1 Tax=Actinoallomurus rhizosphaericola TaxID=2952536 RepID=UPI002092430D|nr:TetR/AcrR family transcriptional regulator [Actinoallomurus rhizosphaericola]MCO5997696.1 TetR/AcrR family transcriptional regulator [Actinoallomurus rhizosphaericola]